MNLPTIPIPDLAAMGTAALSAIRSPIGQGITALAAWAIPTPMVIVERIGEASLMKGISTMDEQNLAADGLSLVETEAKDVISAPEADKEAVAAHDLHAALPKLLADMGLSPVLVELVMLVATESEIQAFLARVAAAAVAAEHQAVAEVLAKFHAVA